VLIVDPLSVLQAESGRIVLVAAVESRWSMGCSDKEAAEAGREQCIDRRSWCLEFTVSECRGCLVRARKLTIRRGVVHPSAGSGVLVIGCEVVAGVECEYPPRSRKVTKSRGTTRRELLSF
jgi:hypothetical protein